MKKLILGLIIFVGIFVIPQISFAYEVLYENDFSGNIGGNCIPGWNGISSTVSASGILKEIKLKTSNIDTSPKATSVQATIHNFISNTTSTSDWGAYPSSTDTYFTLDFSGINQILLTLGDSFFTTVCSNSGSTYIRLYGGDLASQIVYGDFYNPEISISLLYPVNNTSTPLFRNWVVGIDYLTSTTIGTFGVEYGLASNIYNSVDTQSIWNGTSSWGLVDNATKIIIKRNYALIASTTYFAKPYFFNSDNMTFIYGNEINFVFNSSSTPTYTTTTALSQLITPDLRIIGLPLSVSCLDVGNYTIWNMSDWKCLAINIISDLKDSMANFALGIVNQGFDIFKNIFPLNIISKFNDDINMVQATSTDIIITLEGHGSVFPDRTFTILTSSTTAWIKDELNFDYKNFITQLMYLGTGIFMVIITILVIKNSFLVQGD